MASAMHAIVLPLYLTAGVSSFHSSTTK
jgi:hypothetical protein